MIRTTLIKDKLQRLSVVLALLSTCLLPSFSAHAAVLNLPSAPFDGSTNAVKPNFLYVLDNSTSMNGNRVTDATEDASQCKVAPKDHNGDRITQLERDGDELTITLSSGDYRVNQVVMLAIPGNTDFSGVYKVIESNYAGGSSGSAGTCQGWTVQEPTKYNQRAAGWVTPSGETPPYFEQGCAVTSPMPAYSNTSTTKNLGGGQNLTTGAASGVCYWRQVADVCTGGYTGGTSGTSATPGRVLKVKVANAGTSGVFSASETLDASMMPISNETSSCATNAHEPPRAAAKIQQLFYDPTVNYEPPPAPNGLSNPYPNNLLPSMNRANTVNWTKIREDGTKLNASGNQNSGLRNLAVGTFIDMVFCDTPNRPAAFSSDQAWFESSRCKKNDLTSNAVASSPNHPYKYPARTNGGSSFPSVTISTGANSVEHQNGQSKLGKNPVADLYTYGERYRHSAPFYYNVRPIEYCTNTKLTNCKLVSDGAPDATYNVPSYVRYCKRDSTSPVEKTATNLTVSPDGTKCQARYTGNGSNDYRVARYGLFERVDVKSGNTFEKYPTRTDCSGAVGAGGCSYDEEMTNIGNWYAYYSNRIKLMKSASAHAMLSLDENYRVGFMTINSPETAGRYLPINDFTLAQKKDWLLKLYAIVPDGFTPLKGALSKAGQIYAGKHPITGFASDDPVQFSCQQNFTLLTTDGFWNDAVTGVQIDGSTPVGNLDGAPTLRPKLDAVNESGTLADVAKYYFDTDIRDPAFNNCTGAISGEDVCFNKPTSTTPQTQKMVTFTLGLGVDGVLDYQNADYENASSGDYYELKNGLNGVNWPKPLANKASTIDDLWHAAVNSNGTYFSAKSPQELKNALVDTLAAVSKSVKSGAPPAVSSLEPTAGDNFAYTTSYVGGEWSGNVIARELSLNVGSFFDNAAPVWCADNVSILDTSVTPGCVGDLASRAFNDRKIYTKKFGNNDLIDFDYGAMHTSQKKFFKKTYLNGGSETLGSGAGAISFSGSLSQYPGYTPAELAVVGEETLVDFLHGQKTFEDLAANPALDHRIYRKRESVLGDITASDPVHVGKPLFDYLDNGYAAYKTAQAGRAGTVYVGANDGMLHAFDASNGKERWAYIPTILLPKLHKLADKNYATQHVNYVNGDPVAGDICASACNSASADWRTILVTGLEEGGRGFFAMDVTNPGNPTLLWEFDVTEDADLGFSYGKPVITKLADANNTWVVLLTSGYNNVSPGDGKGYLYVLNAKTGAQIAKIGTGVGGSSGLGHVSGLAMNNQKDNTTKYAYGGDLEGNLWKFDLLAGTSQLLAKLTAGGNNQPITTPPLLLNYGTDTLVFVGTGKLLEAADVVNSDTQTLYAIRDDHSGTTLNPHGSSDFIEQVFTTDVSAKSRTVTNNGGGTLGNKKGWYIDLMPGERQTVMGQLIDGELTIPTSVNSGSVCEPEGFGWLLTLDYETGASVDGDPATTISTYLGAPVTGLTTLLKKGTDGKYNSETTASTRDTDTVTKDPNELEDAGAFGGNRLIWRELPVD